MRIETLLIAVLLSGCSYLKMDSIQSSVKSNDTMDLKSAQIQNGQLVISGANFDGVTSATLSDGTLSTPLAILSRTSASLVLAASSSFLMKQATLLTLQTANATTTYPLSVDNVRQDATVGWVAAGPGANPSGSNSPSVAIGQNALAAGGGWGDVGVGVNALNASATGWFNTGVGGYAAGSLTSGHDTTAIGFNAAAATTSGYGNTAIGTIALQTNITGNANVAIGPHALYGASTANFNVVIGSYAGTNSATGQTVSNSVFVGSNSGYSASTGSTNNTFVGFQSGSAVTTGANNILIGAAPTGANTNLTTGSKNILIGYDLSLPSGSASNQLNIGNLIYGTGLNGSGSTVSTGNVGIGTTAPKATLDINGYMRMAVNSSQPVACSSANAGALAMTHTYVGCVCNGSSWVLFADGISACAW